MSAPVEFLESLLKEANGRIAELEKENDSLKYFLSRLREIFSDTHNRYGEYMRDIDTLLRGDK